MRSLLKDMLEVIGYEITLADGGEEALRLIQANQFDLVLTDLNMPGMDGTALLRAIKTNHTDMPVVVITGYGTYHTEKRVMKEGANGYISKPCTLAKIENTLAGVFNSKLQPSD